MMEHRENVHSRFGGKAKQGDIAPYVFVPGSKKRVRAFAEHWESVREIADHYEFLVVSGEYAGSPITACSTGIGGMSVSIAIEELAKLGATTYLRVGVTSPLVDELDYGDLVIATGAVRWDGTSHDYARPEYPALAHHEVVMASLVAAERLSLPYKVGVIGDMASLGPMREDGYRKYLTHRTQPMMQALNDVGVLDGTGEAASLLVQSSIYGFRAGVININSVDVVNKRWDPEADRKAVEAGLETMRVLIEWDRKKRAEGKTYIVPEFSVRKRE